MRDTNWLTEASLAAGNRGEFKEEPLVVGLPAGSRYVAISQRERKRLQREKALPYVGGMAAFLAVGLLLGLVLRPYLGLGQPDVAGGRPMTQGGHVAVVTVPPQRLIETQTEGQLLDASESTTPTEEPPLPDVSATIGWVYVGVCDKDGWSKHHFWPLPECNNGDTHVAPSGFRTSAARGMKLREGPPGEGGLAAIIGTVSDKEQVMLRKLRSMSVSGPPTIYWGEIRKLDK